MFLVYSLGVFPVLYMLAHLCIMYLASLSQSVLAVWGVALVILESLQMDDIRQWQVLLSLISSLLAKHSHLQSSTIHIFWLTKRN